MVYQVQEAGTNPVRVGRIHNSSQSKIANLQHQVIQTEEYVRWFDITVDQVCRVDVLQATQQLVQEELDVLAAQLT